MIHFSASNTFLKTTIWYPFSLNSLNQVISIYMCTKFSTSSHHIYCLKMILEFVKLLVISRYVKIQFYPEKLPNESFHSDVPFQYGCLCVSDSREFNAQYLKRAQS